MNAPRQQGKTPLGTLRHPQQRASVLWLMALLLFAQALIPIQSHTRWAVADDGQVVEICTLQGTVLMTLHADGQPAEPAAERSDRGPAMAFSLLLAEALSTHIDIQPAWLALAAVESSPAVIGTLTRRALRHAHIRAPPSLV
jgi:hypothetical protein